MILFKGIHYPEDVIRHAVFFYVRYHALVKRPKIEPHRRHRFDTVFWSGRASGLGSVAEASGRRRRRDAEEVVHGFS